MTWSTERTFDALCRADLDRVCEEGREEVLRDHAFRILLMRSNSVVDLEKLAFAGERGLQGWTTKELIEITNRFRLLSSPDRKTTEQHLARLILELARDYPELVRLKEVTSGQPLICEDAETDNVCLVLRWAA